MGIQNIILQLRQIKDYKDLQRELVKSGKVGECKINILENINNLDLLIYYLERLDEMVDMDEVKDTVCKQIKYLVVNNSLFNTSKMQSAVITGKPGVGKTKLATILANIWTQLGIIKPHDPEKNKHDDGNNSFFDNFAVNYISLLKENISDMKDTKEETSNLIKKLQDKLNIFETDFSDADKEEINNLIENIKHKTKKSKADEKIQQKIIAPIPKIENEPIKTVTRADFVSNCVGGTAIKTKKLLSENRGKVLFIDEAYLLYLGGETHNDPFGMEALTIINEYMSSNSGEIIIIFSGYEDLMDKSIFKVQPGLKRRCMWNFNIEDYSYRSLAKIFRYQALKDGYKKLPSQEEMCSFFKENYDKFKFFGGDTEKLLHNCNLEFCDRIYDEIFTNMTAENISGNCMLYKARETVLTMDILEKSFDKYKQSLGKVEDEKRLTYYI